MRLLILVLVFSAFAFVGCEKSTAAEKVVKAGMSADMSDEQLLRVMKRDPKKMKVEEARGADGTSFVYTDDEEEISITRSTFSGVIVLRHIKRTGVWQTWELGQP